MTFRVVSAPANGTLTGTPPNLKYKPQSKWVGEETFTYVANDGTVDSALATVRVKVKESNNKPTATDRNITVNENSSKAVVLSGSDADADPLTYSVARKPRNGTLSGTPPNLIYTPDADYRGADSFTFIAEDGVTKSSAATVEINVINPNNKAPVASRLTLAGPVKKTVKIELAASDVDGDKLTYRVVSQPSSGKLTGKPPKLRFKPDKDFTGTVSFKYVANDGVVDSSQATVSITISADTLAARTFGQSKEEVVEGPLPSMTLVQDPFRPGVLSLQITGAPGDIYMLESSPDLSAWSDDEEIAVGVSGIVTLERAIPPGAARGFFRLRTP